MSAVGRNFTACYTSGLYQREREEERERERGKGREEERERERERGGKREGERVHAIA